MVPGNGLASHPECIFMPNLTRIKVPPEDSGVWKSLLNEFVEMNYAYYDDRRFFHSATGLELNQHQLLESRFFRTTVGWGCNDLIDLISS